MWYTLIHTMEYLFSLKRDIVIHAKHRQTLRTSMRSEINQPRKDKHCMTALTRPKQKKQIHRDRQLHRIVVIWAGGDRISCGDG